MVMTTATVGRRVGLLVAVVVAAGIVGWNAWSRGGHETRITAIRVVEPNQLQVTYQGIDCERHRAVRVKESAATVRITIRLRELGACNDAVVPRRTTVELDQSLGSRRVVDGSSGRTISASRLPGPATTDGEEWGHERS